MVSIYIQRSAAIKATKERSVDKEVAKIAEEECKGLAVTNLVAGSRDDFLKCLWIVTVTSKQTNLRASQLQFLFGAREVLM